MTKKILVQVVNFLDSEDKVRTIRLGLGSTDKVILTKNYRLLRADNRNFQVVSTIDIVKCEIGSENLLKLLDISELGYAMYFDDVDKHLFHVILGSGYQVDPRGNGLSLYNLQEQRSFYVKFPRVKNSLSLGSILDSIQEMARNLFR